VPSIQRLWDDRVLPLAVEYACGQSPVRRQRTKVIPRARGRVLELGVGSGYNLPHYEGVDSILAVDPSERLLRRAAERAKAVPFDVELRPTGLEGVTVSDGPFDTVVVTYALCTIPRPVEVLRQARGLIAPGGRLLFTEHGLAPDPGVQRVQRWLNKVWTPLSGGCRLDVDVPDLLVSAGFDPIDVEAMYLPGFRALNYHYWGAAAPAEG
jgi:SAM-dependent methyltransferase